MNLAFLQLDPAERAVYFDEAAARRGLNAAILEKDFWVSWVLGLLFQSPFAAELVFKGGTSLSKVFGILNRFSEDIDLSLNPEFLQLPILKTDVSRNQANLWMEKAEAACGSVVRDVIAPRLEGVARGILGKRPSPWFFYLRDPLTRSPVLIFRYPVLKPDGFAYLQRSVKLEFGSLTEQRPVGRHPVQPWLGELFPEAFVDWQCEVVALEVARTFWEKATILHAEWHRPADKSTPDRFSRHYADTAALAGHPSTLAALADAALRQRVVDWKARFFGSGWARYDLAKPGTFQLVPPDSRRAALERDDRAMREMYLSEPPAFASILQTLADLEQRINSDT